MSSAIVLLWVLASYHKLQQLKELIYESINCTLYVDHQVVDYVSNLDNSHACYISISYIDLHP